MKPMNSHAICRAIYTLIPVLGDENLVSGCLLAVLVGYRGSFEVNDERVQKRMRAEYCDLTALVARICDTTAVEIDKQVEILTRQIYKDEADE